ncbi:hypothetical protein [Halarcobacter anaerophilus]|uniref:DUF3892 domain-containing protein n=1 Tax=Halarcobacter anaerophilus TaxID=877500 RepID=A0A4Q0Y195_9BACT|nr:hypothetical protein [Halarcobacter anaerophilus]QDF29932.1 hypothetical protein AANAER_2476 [Halarcobacter anaerophilus]RXJ62894.1 hypothetical protein CRV06_08650 [Halarcobacter anaerophilus]
MARKKVSTISESSTGRNTMFHDNYSGANMTRSQFVNQIEKGNYSNYHIRVINDIKTPVSNPDPHRDNNLG